jgi:hypothetical protein
MFLVLLLGLTKSLIEVSRTNPHLPLDRRHRCGGVIFGVIFYCCWRGS